jgi:hypothetical protein
MNSTSRFSVPVMSGGRQGRGNGECGEGKDRDSDSETHVRRAHEKEKNIIKIGVNPQNVWAAIGRVKIMAMPHKNKAPCSPTGALEKKSNEC